MVYNIAKNVRKAYRKNKGDSTVKKLTLRIVAAVVAVMLLVANLAGCGVVTATAISFGDVKINANQFCYWMSRFKAMYLYSYFGTTTDNAQYWTSQIANGVTTGDLLNSYAVSAIMTYAVTLKLFDEYGLSLTKEQQNTIDENIQSKITAAGSKAALNNALSAFGVNVNMLKELYTMETKINAVQDYLYGDNGVDKATDEEISEYFNENYYRCKHILIRTDVKYEKDANGAVIVDESTQSYKTTPLTDDEVVAQKELAAELEKRVAAGEDFDRLVLEYSEDTGMQYFDDGYYITSSTTYLPTNVISAVKAMNVGDVQTVESTVGIHIVKRYELKEDAYKTEPYASTQIGDLSQMIDTVKFQELISGYADLVITNDDVIDDYPLAYCSPNFYY